MVKCIYKHCLTFYNQLNEKKIFFFFFFLVKHQRSCLMRETKTLIFPPPPRYFLGTHYFIEKKYKKNSLFWYNINNMIIKHYSNKNFSCKKQFSFVVSRYFVMMEIVMVMMVVSEGILQQQSLQTSLIEIVSCW